MFPVIDAEKRHVTSGIFMLHNQNALQAREVHSVPVSSDCPPSCIVRINLKCLGQPV